MQKKQVAILDFGSSELRTYVAERGVNKTFVIKGQKSFAYDGFSQDGFYDENALKQVLLDAGNFLFNVDKRIHLVYIGVPGAFTQVNVKVSQLAFPKKKKITDADVDNLYDAAFVANSTKKTVINRSAIVYELDDGRRLANPVGAVSQILKGKLSFVLCDNSFIEICRSAMLTCGFKSVEFVSNALAQAMYLIDAETRDKVAVLADVGYISTTVSVVFGDGIIYQNSFDYGGGYVTAGLSERYSIDFAEAEALKCNSSISRIFITDNEELIQLSDGRLISAEDVKKCICYSLDAFCELITESLDNSGLKIPEYVPIHVTGGGLLLRGAKEYVASRTGKVIEVAKPIVPLMDSPLQSSALSVLDIALEQ